VVARAICVVDRAPRSWADAELALADVAALTGEGAAAGALHDAQVALRRSDERYRLIARATTHLVYDRSVADGTVEWSDIVHPQFGHDFAGGPTTTLWWEAQLHPDDRERVTASLRMALDGEAELWTADYRFRRGDGSYAEVLDRGCVVRDAGGRAVRVIGAMSDVTERRQLEERLRQAQKMEAVGRLAGGVAHDFNNVLTAVRSYSELLLDDLGDDPALAPLAADVEEIRRAVDRAAALTRQLLAFSRKQVVTPRRLDVPQVIAGLEPMLRRLTPESITLEIVPPPRDEPAPVVADVGQLEQIVLNLCVNARDAMPHGGTLRVETRPLVVRDGHEWVAIVVRDTGIGMDEATRERIFEPFFTTKAQGKGTGLGLATVYGIVEQAHGLLEVQSEVGAGTTFTVLLRRDDAGEPPDGVGRHAEGAGVAAPGGPTSPDPATRTILVVEDEDAVRTSLRRILVRQGYHVLEARNGADALRVVAGHLDAIDLVLTDVVMPEMGGRELAEWIAGARPEARVVFMSGYTGGFRLLDGSAFVQKPFSAAEVVRVVGEVLAAASS
jgi:two-component system cell cycle sensor histidine kinase/response regulator CckA